MSGLFNQIWNMMCEDEANRQLDPLRAGFVCGLGVYLLGGAALIVALLHLVWFTDKPADLQAYAIGMGAWGTGLGAMITGTGMGLFGKAKGDAA
jgi:hypothetical protein